MATNANTRRRGRGRRGVAPPASASRSVPLGTVQRNVPQNDERIVHRSSTKDPGMLYNAKMNLMASVSRSSGLEKDGDDLKNWNTQEEYRKFIQDKLENVLKCRDKRPTETEIEQKSRLENQENVLILFRKLREGVASSDRTDSFALEAYETSLYISIIFDSPKQTTAIIPHIFRPESDPKKRCTMTSQPSIHTVLCSLLHNLVVSYPSQSQYHRQLRSISDIILPRNSDVFIWLSSLTRTLRMRNYARLAVLGHNSKISNVISQNLNSSSAASSQIFHPNLAHDAVLSLLNSLRQKASEMTWSIIRSAYREFSTGTPDVEVTRAWLVRSLFLESVYGESQSTGIVEWLESKAAVGHVMKKAGQERWIVYKSR